MKPVDQAVRAGRRQRRTLAAPAWQLALSLLRSSRCLNNPNFFIGCGDSMPAQSVEAGACHLPTRRPAQQLPTRGAGDTRDAFREGRTGKVGKCLTQARVRPERKGATPRRGVANGAARVSTRRGVEAALCILLVGGSVAWAERVEKRDRDGDGKAEVSIYLDDAGKPVRSEVDRNNDGKPDVTRWIEEGRSARDQADLNFDGRPDAWTFYRDGLKDLMIMDKNHDGKPDAWFYYGQAGMKLIGGSIDENFDGKTDRSFGNLPKEEKRKPW